ncbi:transcription repressor OFP11-like [Primulina eburnea]|uniref:transcription repressor OFP11-like n=1 Tax=Primulina eburnea TaxID=1245227 RepID=UPI003C6C5C43
MSNILWKSFNLCFSKFKCLPTITFSSPPTIEEQEEEEIQEFAQTNPYTHHSVLIKNYNSLYEVSTSDSLAAAEFSSSSSSPETSPVPDFSSAFASRRFFCSSPGCSNSLLEQPETIAAPRQGAAGGGVAVDKYSPDPYEDFRKSMQEMIEARESAGVEADWEFLHELLVCYLALNPKHTHKFIFGAFADVTVSVVVSSPRANGFCRTPVTVSGIALPYRRRLNFL